MARVTVSYVFADGETIQVSVTGKSSFPDSIAELRSAAIKGFHDSLAEIRTHQAPAEAGE